MKLKYHRSCIFPCLFFQTLVSLRKCFVLLNTKWNKGTRSLSTGATCWPCGVITKRFGELTLQHFSFVLLTRSITFQRLKFLFFLFFIFFYWVLRVFIYWVLRVFIFVCNRWWWPRKSDQMRATRNPARCLVWLKLNWLKCVWKVLADIYAHFREWKPPPERSEVHN